MLLRAARRGVGARVSNQCRMGADPNKREISEVTPTLARMYLGCAHRNLKSTSIIISALTGRPEQVGGLNVQVRTVLTAFTSRPSPVGFNACASCTVPLSAMRA